MTPTPDESAAQLGSHDRTLMNDERAVCQPWARHWRPLTEPVTNGAGWERKRPHETGDSGPGHTLGRTRPHETWR